MTTKPSVKPLLIYIFFFSFLPEVYSQIPDFFDYLPREAHAELADSHSLFAYNQAESGPKLTPDVELLRSVTPPSPEGVIAENLYYIPYKDTAEVDYTSADFHLRLYNLLFAVDTMEGIEYYSASRERMRTLIHESYFISNTESSKPVSPPRHETIPENRSYYLLQNDATFGENVYEVSYYYDENSIRIDMHNHSTLRYGIIPAIRAGELRITLLTQPLEDGLVLYGYIYARPIISFGLQSRIRNSISNRLRAVSSWFLDTSALTIPQLNAKVLE